MQHLNSNTNQKSESHQSCLSSSGKLSDSVQLQNNVTVAARHPHQNMSIYIHVYWFAPYLNTANLIYNASILQIRGTISSKSCHQKQHLNKQNANDKYHNTVHPAQAYISVIVILTLSVFS